jgi:hypothetical protein
MSLRGFLVAVVLASGGLATAANAIGLDVLEGGGSLSSGALTFSDFEVVVSGLQSDLSLYDVSSIAGGIAVTGPIAVSDGAQGDLFLAFTVSADPGLISGVGLSFEGEVSEAGSASSVVETFFEIGDAQLFVFATGGGGLQMSDTLEISPVASLRVFKDILVDSAAPSGQASISRIEQRFVVTPEPAAVVSLGLGLALLAMLRRRQSI